MVKRKRSSNWQVIYMITLPGKRKYIGRDETDSPRYIGTMNIPLLRKLYTQKQLHDITIKKKVLKKFRYGDPKINLREIENRYIIKHKTNCREHKGINLTPACKCKKCKILKLKK